MSFLIQTKEFSKHYKGDIIKNLLVFETLDSTNSTAKSLAREGAEDGTIVIAQTQTHGRGRFDRLWVSPEGGIYISVIIRPKVAAENVPLLSFVAALSVAKTIESFGVHVRVKWPNDVRVNRKKIAGILLESEIMEGSVEYVIIGIGINVNVDITKLPLDIQVKSTSIHVEKATSIDYYEFLTALLHQFEHFYALFRKERYKRIIDEWKKNTDTLGHSVRIQTSTETISGLAFDVDPSGFLLLKTPQGDIKKIFSGDCLYFDELHHA